MTDKQKEKKLVNYWILNELVNLQKGYFANLEEKKINLVTTSLIKFTREKLSNEYLELIKIFPWDDETKKTLLFVYQQLLVMFHPVAPFITENIYQENTKEKILEQKIDLIEFKEEKKEIWQIDCLLLLISVIRNFSQKDKVKKFYLELSQEWNDKFDFSFDFNVFLKPLAKSEVFFLEKNAQKGDFNSFLDLAPFGFLWYYEAVDKEELKKQLDFYQKEWERSNKILSNEEFHNKAPSHLIKKEEDKLIYYENQKKKILSKL
ncbi:MAG: Valine--tRNA ligase [Mycoplasmataceae bacterium]|nr:MAG: Valine--tRNA ligase [Mycoplasmataceae bacterium]